jgi:hypothetical protein
MGAAAFRLALVPGKGRGLVAVRPIARHEIVTRDLSARLAEGDWDRLDATGLKPFVYFRPVGDRIERYFCFGPGAFVNHSLDPNLEKAFEEDEIGVWIVLRAMRDIDPGEELCIRYTAPAFVGLA